MNKKLTSLEKAIRAAESKADIILKDAEAEKLKLNNSVEEKEKRLESMENDLIRFVDSDDTGAYLKTKEQQRNISDLLEMHRKRIEALEDKPLISQKEYDQIISSLYSEYDSAAADIKKDFIRYAKEMYETASDFLQLQESLNKLLKKLQYDVFKGADRSFQPAIPYADDSEAKHKYEPDLIGLGTIAGRNFRNYIEEQSR